MGTVAGDRATGPECAARTIAGYAVKLFGSVLRMQILNLKMIQEPADKSRGLRQLRLKFFEERATHAVQGSREEDDSKMPCRH